jgi:septum formation protein
MPEGSAYYDREAPAYDASRGGAERARAAAEAVLELVPATGSCLDVAGGTGSIGAELAARGLDVVVADLSTGMLRIAATRLPGRVAAAEATRLPVADGSVDLVTTIWFLHLLPEPVADAVAAEAARVLRPGGSWVTTVDKHAAHGTTPRSAADERARMTGVAAGLGLVERGSTTFVGDTDWATAPGAVHQVFTLVAFRRS